VSTSSAIPLSDARRLRRTARRTRSVQLIALVAVLGAAAWLLVAALRIDRTTTAFAPADTTAIVVLDVSASISSETYDRILATLDRLADSNGRFGLVLFSDTAYMALPPGTAAAELRPFVRFFRVPPSTGGGLPDPPRSPWTDTFSAGTRISTGLERALDEIRDRRLERPAVVLISDLDDSTSDLGRLRDVALAYRHAGIPLRVVGLNPAPEDADLIRTLIAESGDLVTAPTRETASSRLFAGRATDVALATVALAVGLALLLVVTQRVRWRST
jgi:hypothetical protein